MIDFHSHILPGIDDGSRNLTETFELLHQEFTQKITYVVATPHFYANKQSVNRFIEKRDNSWETVQKELKSTEHIPFIRLGAEVYYFPGIGKAEMVTKLCIEGTDVLLLELPFCQWTEEVYTDVKRLLEKQKLHIIIAHIERYYEYQKDKSVWNHVLGLPLTFQLNAGCFLNWKKKRFGLQFIKEHGPVILGSDCHNMERRPPNLEAGRCVIEKKLGSDILCEIDKLGERILQI